MSHTRQSDRSHDGDTVLPNTRNDVIGKQVIRSLGSPIGLLEVKVHDLGGERYRVNVCVGQNVMLSRIVDSFFLTVDSEGKIMTCSPEIVRRYGTDGKARIDLQVTS